MAGTQRSNLGRALSGAVLTVLLLSGCASPPEIERNEQGDLIPYSYPEGSGLDNEWSASWEEFETVDETHIRLRYSTGPLPECWRTDVDVVETSETVAITLLTGTLPGTDKSCGEENPILEMSNGGERIIVETKNPIGNRQIIDGHMPD